MTGLIAGGFVALFVGIAVVNSAKTPPAATFGMIVAAAGALAILICGFAAAFRFM